MKAVHPYLNFLGNTEEAFEFYRSVFGGEFLAIVRFRDFGDGTADMPEADRDKIAHIALPLGDGSLLMGTDALEAQGHSLTVGNNTYIYLEADTAAEADRLFERLSDGGDVEMALQPTAWAEAYGSCRDRFGVQWMVSYTGDANFFGASGS